MGAVFEVEGVLFLTTGFDCSRLLSVTTRRTYDKVSNKGVV
jgi:hypothetical protein